MMSGIQSGPVLSLARHRVRTGLGQEGVFRSTRFLLPRHLGAGCATRAKVSGHQISVAWVRAVAGRFMLGGLASTKTRASFLSYLDSWSSSTYFL